VLGAFPQYENAGPDSPLYKKCMEPSDVDQFRKDCLNDALPAVSWLYPYGRQLRASAPHAAAGADFVSSIVDAIAANPKVWAKTAFILNYDENDGLFDHVAPPTAPPGTRDEYIGGLPIGAGFRVPCIIVSPWTAGGWVCSEPFDHTSVLQFLESSPASARPTSPTGAAGRSANLTSAFRFQDLAAEPPSGLPDTAPCSAVPRMTRSTCLIPVCPRPDAAGAGKRHAQTRLTHGLNQPAQIISRARQSPTSRLNP